MSQDLLLKIAIASVLITIASLTVALVAALVAAVTS